MSEAEWLIRRSRIDARLRSLNPRWRLVPYRDGMDLSSLDCTTVEELPTVNGPAEYGLFVKGKLVGLSKPRKSL